MNSNNPVDPKVIAGTAVTGVAGFVVVLLMNIIQGEPLDVAALEGLISAVVVAVLAFAGAWLKRTPLETLLERAAADPKVANVEAHNAAGASVGNAGLFDPKGPGVPNERGHMSATLVILIFVIAIVVSLLMILLLRQF